MYCKVEKVMPIRQYVQFESNNAMSALEKIINIIQDFKHKYNADIAMIVVEKVYRVNSTELMETVELIGALKWHYRHENIFFHHPNNKNKDMIAKMIKQKGKKNEHAIHARAILESHLTETINNHKCYGWKGQLRNHDTT